MKLLNLQKKFILSKPKEYTIIKGKSNTGKSEALMHRILNIVNNFAYEKEDKILFVQKNKKSLENSIREYKNIKEENKYEYMSLLASSEKPKFLCFQELLDKFIVKKHTPSLNEKICILNELIENNNYKKCKNIKKDNIHLLLNEIKYMKNNKISTLEDFMILIGGPLRLRKSSQSRKAMFKLFQDYNNELEGRNFSDEEDKLLEGIESIFREDYGFVHIFIDNAEEFSKLELEFILALQKRKEYSTLTAVVDTDKGENIYSSLVKKGRVYGKRVFGDNKKIFNFKTNVLEKESTNSLNINEQEEYTFIDLKHRRNVKFSIENKENFIEENNKSLKKEELQEVPVFNNIAAGEPILISPEQEDIFKLPKYWLKGTSEKFILKVKGDSMIEANIHNGDLVIIEQTKTPVNGDIIAVNINGSATLKTLKLGIDEVILMPANINYEPIHVSKDQEFYVLGKAIGVIRK